MVPDITAKKPSPNTGYSGRRIAAAEPECYAMLPNFYMIFIDYQAYSHLSEYQ
jgi:hypothetical protein